MKRLVLITITFFCFLLLGSKVPRGLPFGGETQTGDSSSPAPQFPFNSLPPVSSLSLPIEAKAPTYVCDEYANVDMFLGLDHSSSMVVWFDPDGNVVENKILRASIFAGDLFIEMDATGYLGKRGYFYFCRCVPDYFLLDGSIQCFYLPLGNESDGDDYYVEALYELFISDAGEGYGVCSGWGDDVECQVRGDDRLCISGPKDGTSLYEAIRFGASELNYSTTNIKLLVIITDGIDMTSEMSYGTNKDDAVAAIARPDLVTELIYVGAGSDELAEIANLANLNGGNAHYRHAESSELNELVQNVVAHNCKNYRPHADMEISDTELQLGIGESSITFDGSPSSDYETTSDASLTFEWTFTQPNGDKFPMPGIAPSLTFNDDDDGNWRVRLKVTDTSGASDTTEPVDFWIITSPPNLTLEGGGTIDVLDKIILHATANDPDGGEISSYEWRVANAPEGGSFPQDHTWPTQDVSFDTTQNDITLVGNNDIGDWIFECTVTDNEDQTARKQVHVEVRNLPPEVNLSGHNSIRVGEPIKVEATITDRDGGELTFQWDFVQAPVSAGVSVDEPYSSGSGQSGTYEIEIPTDDSYAGTWIVRLMAMDNEGEPNQEEALFTVLVDGPPEAVINGPDVPVSSQRPLELDGSGSRDPDSPSPDQCPDLPHCHKTDGRDVTGISQGIAGYYWSLIDVPPEHWSDYPTDRIDELFDVRADSPQLTLDAGALKTGDWTFKLQVWDAEENEDSTTFVVTVVDPNLPPIAMIDAPPYSRYTTDASGYLYQAIVLDGSRSHDIDNILAGEEPTEGIDYQWSILQKPTGCIPPDPPSELAEYTLYLAGEKVESACHGFWEIELTVTDNDSPALTGSAQARVVIGNCPQDLCIDYPTTANPQYVEFTKDTDILICYHLDSALYDYDYEDDAFSHGMFAMLEIFHESDPTIPVYTSFEPNPLASDKGGFLVFQWYGYSDPFDERPQPGRYNVEITLVNWMFGETASFAAEPNAIWIAVAEPKILPTSDKYINRDDLSAGTDQVTIDYEITGNVIPDELRWRVRDASECVVFESTLPLATSGTIDWDGQVPGNCDGQVAGATIAPGVYTAEIEAYRAGSSLGVSDLYDFAVYRLALEPSTGPVSDTPPGLFVFVNSDDDNMNNVSDLTETAIGEDDLVAITITVKPLIEGVVTLSSGDATPPFTLWDTAAKGVETAIPATFNTPADSVPTQLYVEGQAAGESTLSLELQTADGVTLGPVTIALTMIEVQVMEDSNSDFRISDDDFQMHFVRIGLWDYAFRMAADAFGGVGTLYNEEDEARLAATGNPENFIGRDSRRFYYRVTDPTANMSAWQRDEIPLGNFEWYTIKADKTDDDYPPNDASLTLLETDNDTDVFISPAVMLVSDRIDRDQGTNTGLSSHPGIALYDQANHRTRQVSGPDGSVIAHYYPLGQGSSDFELETPLFQRNPEERRVLTVHIINFSDTNNLGIAAIPQATIDDAMNVIRERLAPAGIRVDLIYDPARDLIDLPVGSAVNLNSVAGFVGGFGTLAPSPDQSALINLVRAIDPSSPANANTIYVLFVGRFAGGSRGQSFPDGWIPGNSPARNFTFVAGRAAQIDYTAVHEIGHMLLNETLTAQEANGTDPGWAGGGHYGGPQADFNLMRRGTIATAPRQVDNTKRLWNDTAVHIVRQIKRMREDGTGSSRFLTTP